MPTTSNNDIEDIFGDVDTNAQPPAFPTPVDSMPPQLPEKLSETSSVPVTPPPPQLPSQRLSVWHRIWLLLYTYKKIVILVASILIALLLLSGILWLIFQRQPITEPSEDITDSTITGQPLDDLLNADTSPVNSTVPGVNSTTLTDTDYDGLSDDEETIYNTNPKKKDTDDDGLSDREEVKVYLTDPRNPDTDGDGYTDGKEVTNFYHPNDPDPKKRLFELPE